MKKIVPNDAVLIPDNAKRVFHGIMFDVYHWPQKRFDDSEATFEMLKRVDSAEVICIVDGKILVLNEEQSHRGTRRRFPGGRVDKEDESILAAIKRELLEETGYEFAQWRLIRVSQFVTKIERFDYMFVAWDVEAQTEAHPDPGEKIVAGLLPFDEVKRLVLDSVGFLGENRDIFESTSNVQGLTAFPEFKGKEVNR